LYNFDKLNTYSFHITLYGLAFTGAIFIGLTFALLLWFANNINRSANRFLALALLVMILWMARLLAIDIRLETYLPHWDRLPLEFLLALGPLLYFYVLKITRPKDKFARKDLIHFGPLLLEQAMLAFRHFDLALQLLIFISVIAYLHQAYKLIERFYSRLQPVMMDRSRLEYRWLRRLLAATAVLWTGWLLCAIIVYVGYGDRAAVQVYYPFYIFFAVIIIWTAVAAFLKPLAAALAQTAAPAKPFQVPIELRAKGTLLKKTMEAHRYYLDPELNLASLAEKLRMQPHELSKTINTVFKKSFTDFVNEYRVYDMVAKMQDPAFVHMTLMGIAYEAGFNSKATFNRSFKQVMGKTAAECKNELEKDGSSYHLRRSPRPGAVISNHKTTLTWGEVKFNRYSMFRNYVKIAWRSLRSSPATSLINIAGLSTGMACFIIIFLYIKSELSYDRYHANADHIYRVVKDFVNEQGTTTPDATTPPALAPTLRSEVPEVANATRLMPAGGRKYLIQYGDRAFYETRLMRIDTSFFSVFDFAFASGSKTNFYKSPQSILLTQTAAKKYFGKEDATGKTLRINVNNGQLFTVAGVLKDVPLTSHFTFDFLIPFVSTKDSVINNDWEWNGFYTYALLKQNASAAAFTGKLQPLFHKYQPRSKNKYHAQLLTDIHLRSNLKWELGVNGDINYIRILAAIAFFVIVIAGINYVNLATARSVKRAREVGVRKVAGASKRLLAFQFIMEAICHAFLGFIVAVIAVLVLLPVVNNYVGVGLALFDARQWPLWLQLPAIPLIIGLVAGLYPALQLSAFKPVEVLKGRFNVSLRGQYLRKALVVFQFAISAALIVSFFVIYRQANYITQKKLGFDTDNIMLMPNVRGNGINVGTPGNWEDNVRKLPAVKSIARADGILGGENSVNGLGTQGSHISLNFMRIDHALLPTMQLELAEGRNFLNHPTADSASLILNEEAVKELGLKKPYVGKQVAWDDDAGKTHPVTIVGVVKDFHFTSLHEQIKPFGFIAEENNGSTFFIKLHSRNLGVDIAAIKKAWLLHNPDKPFDYTFQDEQVARLYTADTIFKNLFACITALAVLIACLGLFGLTIFTTEARTKEIGIRKVLGASATSILHLLSKDFLQLIAIAFVIAAPAAWYFMHNWLQSYAYRVGIGWQVFAIAGLAITAIACVTISAQALKAALANPVKSLRTE